MENYFGSQQHWEDNINHDYDERERHDNEQKSDQVDDREQEDDRKPQERQTEAERWAEFIKDNGLGGEDLINDITMPQEI
jgi:hypothetical protein